MLILTSYFKRRKLMPQSQQDDNYDALETFAETTYMFLVLKAIQQRLSQDEVWLLERASRAAALVHGGAGGREHRRIAGQDA
jgi:hypothetical protein